MLFQTIYSSKAAQPMDAAALQKILDDARRGNEAREVSGALVYVDGVFFQILEGEREAVEDLVENIRQDSRHTSMKVFHNAEIEQRIFPHWRMAYLARSASEMAAWAGLEGTSSVDSLLQQVGADDNHVPKILVNILQALVSHRNRQASC